MNIRDITPADLTQFVVHDQDGFYIKHNGTETSWNVEENLEDAQLFSKEEAQDVLDDNPERNFTMTELSYLVGNKQFEIHEA